MSNVPTPSAAYTVANGVSSNDFAVPFLSLRAPTSSDINFPIGKRWINTSSNVEYVLTSISTLGGTASASWGANNGTAIATLTADSGGAISPSAGNINELGTANQITTTGSGSTITWSIPATFIAPGSIASATTLTATLGNITATNGNLVLTAAGNKVIRTSVASTTTAGANSTGTVTLVGGTATISTTAIATASQVRIWRQSVGATGAAALGALSVGTIVNGTSFVINAWQAANATALQTTDVSVIGWDIVN